MAISAAELPQMAGTTGSETERAKAIRERLRGSLRRVAFLVVPSAVAFAIIGGSIVALLFQTGRFTAADTEIVWMVLAGSAIGLPAGTQSRLLSSAFYALGDPKKPLYAALVDLAFGGIVGYLVALPLRHAFGYSPAWGAFGLTAAAGVAAWIELFLLLRWLRARIGEVALPMKLVLGATLASTVAGAAGYGAAKLALQAGARAWMSALLACAVFGVLYLAIMSVARVPEAAAFTRRVLRRR
jgi:putative peptidoglycan lipid II flippase